MKRAIHAGLALILAAPAGAQAPVALAAFDSIELRGGGRVTVRHGAEQQVTMTSGDPAMTRFSVDRQGQLRIDACVRDCRDYDLRIEIVTPDLDAVAVVGGGIVRTSGAFPDRAALAVAVNGGGLVDVAGVEAASVAASVRGGGLIRTHARDSLVASVNGGGAINYRGDPSVTSSVRGGGAVAPVGRN